MIRLLISAVGTIKKDAPIIVATGTAGTGVATKGTGIIEWLEWIPTDIGKLATLVGILATLILTSTAWYSRRLNDKKTLLEIKILEHGSKDITDITLE